MIPIPYRFHWWKLLIAAILLGGYHSLQTLIPNTVGNTTALAQLNDSPMSSVNYQLYEQLWGSGWILVILLLCWLFWADLYHAYSLTKKEF